MKEAVIKQIERVFRNISEVTCCTYQVGKYKSFFYIETIDNSFYACFKGNKLHSFTKEVSWNKYSKEDINQVECFTRSDIQRAATKINVSYPLLNKIKLGLVSIFPDDIGLEWKNESGVAGKYAIEGIKNQEELVLNKFQQLFINNDSIKKAKLSIQDFYGYKLMLELDNNLFLNFKFDLVMEDRYIKDPDSDISLMSFTRETQYLFVFKSTTMNQGKKRGEIIRDRYPRVVNGVLDTKDEDKATLLDFDLKDVFLEQIAKNMLEFLVSTRGSILKDLHNLTLQGLLTYDSSK